MHAVDPWNRQSSNHGSMQATPSNSNTAHYDSPCRPHFALDMDTKEEFFIELILSRHARKLLTTTSLHDLGLFAAHLDFNLVQWMGRERLGASCSLGHSKTCR